MFVGLGFTTCTIAILNYTRINRKRAREMEQNGGVHNYTVEDIHELGDRAPDFVYTI